jgi:hypothetical protein
MPTRREGVTAIAAAVEDRLQQEQVEQYQFDLLMPETRFAPGSDEHNKLVATVKRNHIGRPPGSRNIATRHTLDIIRKLFGDPLLERARNLAHTPESLAVELACSKLEAFALLDKIRADLAQFCYPRLAPVDLRGQAAVPSFHMHVNAGGPASHQVAGAVGMAPAWDNLDIEDVDEEQPQPQTPAQENGGT